MASIVSCDIQLSQGSVTILNGFEELKLYCIYWV